MARRWQLVLIAWGTKYDVSDINLLVGQVRAHATGLARVVLLSDRARAGLAQGIELLAHPPEFLDAPLRRGGCQAKLAMFKPGLLPDDMPAIFVDLDTVVLGDLGRLLDAQHAPDDVAMLPVSALGFGPVSRLLWRLSGRRRFERGNSSIVVFHPSQCGYIADRFLAMYADQPDLSFRHMRADDRFISWVAQPHMRTVPHTLAVKFPAEFMLRWLWMGRLRGMLPWVKARRAALVAITLSGGQVKPETLSALPDGALVVDRRGRRMIWSDNWLGPVRRRLLDYLDAGAHRDP